MLCSALTCSIISSYRPSLIGSYQYLNSLTNVSFCRMVGKDAIDAHIEQFFCLVWRIYGVDEDLKSSFLNQLDSIFVYYFCGTIDCHGVELFSDFRA